MKRYIKLVFSDENGRTETTIKGATDVQIDAARRFYFATFCDEPVTDAEWAEAKAARAERSA